MGGAQGKRIAFAKLFSLLFPRGLMQSYSLIYTPSGPVVPSQAVLASQQLLEIEGRQPFHLPQSLFMLLERQLHLPRVTVQAPKTTARAQGLIVRRPQRPF